MRATVSSPLKRSFWYCAGLILLYNSVFFVWHLIRPGSQDLFFAVNDWAQMIGQVLMIPFCMYGVGRLWSRARASGGSDRTVRSNGRWVPVLLGFSLVSESMGLGIYAYYEIVLHQFAPFPSWADAGLLGAYPFLLLAILLLPTRPMSGVARMRVLLDGLMIMTAVVTFSWYFILGPTLLDGDETIVARMIGTAYPLADLVLILCLLLLSFRVSDATLRPMMHILSAALVVIIITDSFYDYQTLHSAFEAGSWLEQGWLMGYMLLGLAAQAMPPGEAVREVPVETSSHQLPSRQETADVPSLRRTLLPYAFVPAVMLLAISIWNIGASDDNLEAGVYVGGAILIGLVLVRQIFSTWETNAYAKRTRQLNVALHVTQADLQTKNHALSEANARLESLATTDPLTGLPNHRALIAAIEQELNRSRRHLYPCTLLFMDLDHFKAINDGYGHSAGDAILREFASTVQSLLRGIDTLGRWGGEEFVVILPETGTEDALIVAERVRAAIAVHTFQMGGGLRLTCSLGVAAYPADAQEREELVVASDRAMYGAKMLGRNQVRVASDPAILALDAGQLGSREDAALVGTVEALTSLIEARDHYTGEHTSRVSALATRLALALGLDASEAYMIGVAGRLHDIGKVAVPDAVLQKPTCLTEEEYALMQRHAVVGGDVVSRVPSLRGIASIIRAHHERWDGSGYPDGLAGEHIPLGARILAVVDAYEAMTTDRAYQQARDEVWARTELRCCAGTQFDPVIVEVLERVLTATKVLPELVEA